MKHEWVVIGGGVAGITAVAKLLEENVDGRDIHWICSDFSVGDLGRKWRNVSGNTAVKRVKEFLLAYEAFDLSDKTDDFKIFNMQEDDTCYLRDIVIPLEHSTKVLSQKVNTYKNLAKKIDASQSTVDVTLANNQIIKVNKAIVAIGCEPRPALYDNITEIPLDVALDPSRLNNAVLTTDTVAVFGSSHSAILILKSLSEAGVTNIFNFYLDDIKYAEEMQDGIKNDNTGLKGVAADWAKQYLSSENSSIIRVKSSKENLEALLPKANRAIYSIGFERRKLIINGDSDRGYDKNTGVIVNNVYGFGIAYPRLKKDLSGQNEYQVGVVKFIKQINECFHSWNQQLKINTIIKLIKESCQKNDHNFKLLMEDLSNKIDERVLNLCYQEDCRHTRTSLYNDDKFEVLLLRWPPGSKSTIHDHGSQLCYVSLLTGELINLLYGFNESREFLLLQESALFEKIVYEARNSEVHSIHNKGERVAYTLHIYSKPVKKCKVFDDKGNYKIKDLIYDKII